MYSTSFYLYEINDRIHDVKFPFDICIQVSKIQLKRMTGGQYINHLHELIQFNHISDPPFHATMSRFHVPSLCLIHQAFFSQSQLNVIDMDGLRRALHWGNLGQLSLACWGTSFLISGLNCVYITSHIVLIQKYTEIERGSYQRRGDNNQRGDSTSQVRRIQATPT
jgi:hypothetical protein